MLLNLMKLVSPPWTSDDEGKVLSIKENKLAWVEMNGTPVEPEIEEYKWVILPNKYTIYNEKGTVLKTENKTLNEWEAPISGDYVIQLHAAGGKGGNTYAKYVSNGASYPMTQYTVTGATGGGGGGSAGSFLGGSLTGGEGEVNEAEGKTSNLGPAIIIRRKLE